MKNELNEDELTESSSKDSESNWIGMAIIIVIVIVIVWIFSSRADLRKKRSEIISRYEDLEEKIKTRKVVVQKINKLAELIYRGSILLIFLIITICFLIFSHFNLVAFNSKGWFEMLGYFTAAWALMSFLVSGKFVDKNDIVRYIEAKVKLYVYDNLQKHRIEAEIEHKTTQLSALDKELEEVEIEIEKSENTIQTLTRIKENNNNAHT